MHRNSPSNLQGDADPEHSKRIHSSVLTRETSEPHFRDSPEVAGRIDTGIGPVFAARGVVSCTSGFRGSDGVGGTHPEARGWVSLNCLLSFLSDSPRSAKTIIQIRKIRHLPAQETASNADFADVNRELR